MLSKMVLSPYFEMLYIHNNVLASLVGVFDGLTAAGTIMEILWEALGEQR